MTVHTADAATLIRRAQFADEAATALRRQQFTDEAATALKRQQNRNAAATAERRQQFANAAATAARRQEFANEAATAARRQEFANEAATLARRKEFANEARTAARREQFVATRAAAIRERDVGFERFRGPMVNGFGTAERMPQRNFVHRRLFGAAKGFFTGGVTGAIGGFVAPTRPRTRAPSTTTFPLAPPPGRIPTRFIPDRCPPPLILTPDGDCVSAKSSFGQRELEGQAVMGRFGPGMVATPQVVEVSRCPTGMALGKDEICYDHLPNRDRKYPRGRRPLLTGGELRAISKAGAAARKLKRANKSLEALGLMPKRTARRRLPPHQHQIKVT